MAKHFGALVGAVKQAVPYQPVEMGLEKTRDEVLVRDTFVAAATPFTDTVSLGIFSWESMFDPLSSDLYFDALGANTTISIGDVTFPTALINAQDTHTGASSVKPFKPATLTSWYQPLWQLLGYADLPTAKKVGLFCEVLLTFNTANATGNLAWQFKGQQRG